MKKENWLYDENGNVRKELYTQGRVELNELERNLTTVPDWCQIPPELAALKRGDTIYIKPEYEVANKFGGRMTFIQLSGVSDGPCLFCRTDDGGGGFIGREMLVDKTNPTLVKR